MQSLSSPTGLVKPDYYIVAALIQEIPNNLHQQISKGIICFAIWVLFLVNFIKRVVVISSSIAGNEEFDDGKSPQTC